MTVYGTPPKERPTRLRPTLRLRLTMLNGLLLAGAGLLLLLLSWLLVGGRLTSSDTLTPDSKVVVVSESGQREVLDAREWQPAEWHPDGADRDQ